MTAAFALHDVTLGYERHPAVHHLSGAIAPGTLMAVVGPNGAGKSTLFKGLVGAIKPLSGRIERPGAARHDIAYLPQASDINRSFPISIYDLVAMGLWRQAGILGRLPKTSQSAIASAIAAVGLTGFERRPMDTLSGGQIQRMLFARLLLQDARIIILDEPFTAIDAKTTADLCGLVLRWHGERRTVVAALHDLDLVRTYFPETLLLARTSVAWGPTAQVLTADNLLTARRMCEAFDDQAPPCADEAA